MSRAILALLFAAGAVCAIAGWAMQVTGGAGTLLTMTLPLGLAAVHGAALLALRRGGRLRPSAAGIRLCLYLLLAAAVALVLCCSPFDPKRATLVLAAALALAAGILLRRGPERRPSTVITLLDVVAAALSIALIAAELSLRVAAGVAAKPAFAQRDMPPAARIEHHRFRPGAVVDGSAVNAEGFRGPLLAAESSGATVVVVGDRALGAGLPFGYGAVAVATRSAGIERIVARQLDGLSTPEYRLLAIEALAATPRALIVAVDLGDDLGELVRVEGGWRVLANWLDRENVLLTRLFDHVMRRLRERELGIADPPAEARIAATAEEVARDFPWIADPTLERPRRSAEWFDESVRHTLAVHDRPTAQIDRAMIDLGAIADRCRERGVGFGVVLVPARHQVDPALWNRLRGSRGDAQRDAATTELRRALRNRGIETLDLTATLRSAEAAAHAAQVFHRGDLRLNALGNRLAGEAIAGLIETLARQDGR